MYLSKRPYLFFTNRRYFSTQFDFFWQMYRLLNLLDFLRSRSKKIVFRKLNSFSKELQNPKILTNL